MEVGRPTQRENLTVSTPARSSSVTLPRMDAAGSSCRSKK